MFYYDFSKAGQFGAPISTLGPFTDGRLTMEQDSLACLNNKTYTENP